MPQFRARSTSFAFRHTLGTLYGFREVLEPFHGFLAEAGGYASAALAPGQNSGCLLCGKHVVEAGE